MTLKELIDQDLKAALLGGDRTKVDTLRGLKSVILYDEVAKGKKDTGISDTEIITLLQKEVKKRQESADLYLSGGDSARSTQELTEKAIIEAYLPKGLTDVELDKLVDDIINQMDNPDVSQMGKIITAAKEKSGGAADGAMLAKLVKEKLVK